MVEINDTISAVERANREVCVCGSIHETPLLPYFFFSFLFLFFILIFGSTLSNKVAMDSPPNVSRNAPPQRLSRRVSLAVGRSTREFSVPVVPPRLSAANASRNDAPVNAADDGFSDTGLHTPRGEGLKSSSASARPDPTEVMFLQKVFEGTGWSALLSTSREVIERTIVNEVAMATALNSSLIRVLDMNTEEEGRLLVKLLLLHEATTSPESIRHAVETYSFDGVNLLLDMKNFSTQEPTGLAAVLQNMAASWNGKSTGSAVHPADASVTQVEDDTKAGIQLEKSCTSKGSLSSENDDSVEFEVDDASEPPQASQPPKPLAQPRATRTSNASLAAKTSQASQSPKPLARPRATRTSNASLAAKTSQASQPPWSFARPTVASALNTSRITKTSQSSRPPWSFARPTAASALNTSRITKASQSSRLPWSFARPTVASALNTSRITKASRASRPLWFYVGTEATSTLNSPRFAPVSQYPRSMWSYALPKSTITSSRYRDPGDSQFSAPSPPENNVGHSSVMEYSSPLHFPRRPGLSMADVSPDKRLGLNLSRLRNGVDTAAETNNRNTVEQSLSLRNTHSDMTGSQDAGDCSLLKDGEPSQTHYCIESPCSGFSQNASALLNDSVELCMRAGNAEDLTDLNVTYAGKMPITPNSSLDANSEYHNDETVGVAEAKMELQAPIIRRCPILL